MTTETMTLQTGAGRCIVELSRDCIVTYQRIGDPQFDFFVQLFELMAEQPQACWPVHYRYKERFAVQLSAICVDVSSTNRMLCAQCWDWYMRFLHMRRGGLRATWRVWRLLKDMRDASRMLKSQLDEREAVL